VKKKKEEFQVVKHSIQICWLKKFKPYLRAMINKWTLLKAIWIILLWLKLSPKNRKFLFYTVALI